MATAKSANTVTGQEKFKEAYNLAGEAAADMMDSVKEQAKVKMETNKAKADELGARAEKMIIEKPLLSIGAAFVAGWAFSKLIK